jgi:hypothetical protein
MARPVLRTYFVPQSGRTALVPRAGVDMAAKRTCRIIRHSVRVSRSQKLRDFHQFSAQALISNAEVEFEELTRLSLRDEFTPILRFGGLL